MNKEREGVLGEPSVTPSKSFKESDRISKKPKLLDANLKKEHSPDPIRVKKRLKIKSTEKERKKKLSEQLVPIEPNQDIEQEISQEYDTEEMSTIEEATYY